MRQNEFEPNDLYTDMHVIYSPLLYSDNRESWFLASDQVWLAALLNDDKEHSCQGLETKAGACHGVFFMSRTGWLSNWPSLSSFICPKSKNDNHNLHTVGTAELQKVQMKDASDKKSVSTGCLFLTFTTGAVKNEAPRDLVRSSPVLELCKNS